MVNLSGRSAVNRPIVGMLALASFTLAGCAGSPTGPGPSFSSVAEESPSPALLYFEEIALGLEYGEAADVVHKWSGPILVELHGAPTAEDRAALADVVADLGPLIGAERISVVEEGGNVDLWFAPVSQFPTIEPHYVPGNLGFFWIAWNGTGTIHRARVLIASDQATQAQRAHLIREELTQALGLVRDSDRYQESVFYQGWSETARYAAIDEAVIRMLYRAEVRPGMRRAEVIPVLKGLGQPS
jgi:hypothetical protein